MKTILMIGTLIGSLYSAQLIINFGQKTGGQDWVMVNDGVMGGMSKGNAHLTANSLLFKGVLSLRNNGGFASVRSPRDKFDLSNYTKVKVKIRTKGRKFLFRLAQYDRFYRPIYRHDIEDTDGEWKIVELNLLDFKAYTMGEFSGVVKDTDAFKNIIRVDFMLSDKKEGPFEIEIDFIRFE